MSNHGCSIYIVFIYHGDSEGLDIVAEGKVATQAYVITSAGGELCHPSWFKALPTYQVRAPAMSVLPSPVMAHLIITKYQPAYTQPHHYITYKTNPLLTSGPNDHSASECTIDVAGCEYKRCNVMPYKLIRWHLWGSNQTGRSGEGWLEAWIIQASKGGSSVNGLRVSRIWISLFRCGLWHGGCMQ